MRKEGGALDLLDVVEAGNADEALGEGGGAGADLLEDLIGVGAAVHGELPHNPVAVVVVARGDGHVHTAPAVGVGVGLGGGLELNAGGPAVVEEVLDLAGDLLVGEGGEEGESLEEPGEGGGSAVRIGYFWFLSGLFGGRVWIKREFAGLASPARGPRAHERARDLAKIIRWWPGAKNIARDQQTKARNAPRGASPASHVIRKSALPGQIRRPAGSQSEPLRRRKLARDTAYADVLRQIIAN